MDLNKIIQLFALLESEFPCGERGRHSITYRGNPDELFLDIWIEGQLEIYKLDGISELNDPIKLVDDIKLLEGIKQQ